MPNKNKAVNNQNITKVSLDVAIYKRVCNNISNAKINKSSTVVKINNSADFDLNNRNLD